MHLSCVALRLRVGYLLFHCTLLTRSFHFPYQPLQLMFQVVRMTHCPPKPGLGTWFPGLKEQDHRFSAVGVTRIQAQLLVNFQIFCTARLCSHMSCTARSQAVLSWNNTPFKPSSPQEATPSCSELGMSSGASNADSTFSMPMPKHHDKMRAARLMVNANDPAAELRTHIICLSHYITLIVALGSEIQRIVKTRSVAYENYELPTSEVKDDGPPTQHIFKCKWYVTISYPKSN